MIFLFGITSLVRSKTTTTDSVPSESVAVQWMQTVDITITVQHLLWEEVNAFQVVCFDHKIHPRIWFNISISISFNPLPLEKNFPLGLNQYSKEIPSYFLLPPIHYLFLFVKRNNDCLRKHQLGISLKCWMRANGAWRFPLRYFSLTLDWEHFQCGIVFSSFQPVWTPRHNYPYGIW